MSMSMLIERAFHAKIETEGKHTKYFIPFHLNIVSRYLKPVMYNQSAVCKVGGRGVIDERVLQC